MKKKTMSSAFIYTAYPAYGVNAFFTPLTIRQRLNVEVMMKRAGIHTSTCTAVVST